MTNPDTPAEPQGTGPVPGEPQYQPSLAPQPYAPTGGMPQQPLGAQGQPPQPGFATQGQPLQQPYPPFAPQQPAPALPVQDQRPTRPPRPKTDPNGVPYGVGPFTLRDVIFLGATALVFVASFLPLLGGDYARVFGYASAWSPAGWLVIPAAILLVAAAGLMVLRRFLPKRRLFVGSLSVDQFASVASVVTAGFYVGTLFLIAGFPSWFGGGSDILEPGVGVFVGLFFSLVAVAVTTLGTTIPGLRTDFAGRGQASAHVLARPASVVPRRPRAERPPAPQQPAPYPGQPGMPMQQAGPGEFAAYRRKGSQPDPLPVDDRTAGAYPAPPAGEAVGAIAYQPEQAAPPRRVTAPEPDAGILASHTIEPSPASDHPDQPVVPQPVAEQAITDAAPVETTRVLPTDSAGEPQSDSRAPGGGMADVEPRAAAAVPATEYLHDEDRTDDDVDGDIATEPAPRSAFSHISARTAAGPANAATASDGYVSEQPTAVFSTQPFWVYSPVPRPVVDEATGATVFEIGPSAWALAIVDRGSELVLRHDDGRVGVLRNLDGITRS